MTDHCRESSEHASSATSVRALTASLAAELDHLAELACSVQNAIGPKAAECAAAGPVCDLQQIDLITQSLSDLARATRGLCELPAALDVDATFPVTWVTKRITLHSLAARLEEPGRGQARDPGEVDLF